MAAKRKKPKGFRKMDRLMRMLIQVPRAELEDRLAKRKMKRRKKS